MRTDVDFEMQLLLEDTAIMGTQPASILRVFGSPPIYDAIFSCLSPPTLVQTSRTCRDVYHAIKDFNKRAYNIMKHLQFFFDDPLSFRSMQASTGAVVSGSNALQFLERTYYPGSDLDLYVAQEFAFEVGSWVAQHEGYAYVPSMDQDPDFAQAWALSELHTPSEDPLQFDRYRTSGVSGVFDFKKEGRPKVQLVATSTSPVHSILCFHNTCVMNFITFEGAYSLYPGATFSAHEAVTIGRIQEHEIVALSKYATRGWRIHSRVWDAKALKHLFFFGEIRHVLDSHSWVIPFDIEGVHLRSSPTPSSPAFTSDPSRYNSWVMKSDATVRTRFFAVNSKLLKYKYLVAEEAVLLKIALHLSYQGRFEFTKVGSLEGDEREAAWTFWDDLYPHWCESYEAETAAEKCR